MSSVTQRFRRMSSTTTEPPRWALSRESEDDARSGIDLWQGVQRALLNIFQSEPGESVPSKINILEVNDTCRLLMCSDLKNSIISRFQESLLVKCLTIVREALLLQPHDAFLDKLANWWSHFYQKLIPLVCMALLPVPTFGMTVRQICLKGFRDVVLTKLFSRLKNCLRDDEGIPIEIVQMLLVVQSIPETGSDQYRQTEEIAGLIIRPYLQNMRAIGTQLELEANESCHSVTGPHPSYTLSNITRRTLQGNHSSTVSHPETTSPVQGHDSDRCFGLNPVDESPTPSKEMLHKN